MQVQAFSRRAFADFGVRARRLAILISLYLSAGGLRDVEQFEMRRIASRLVKEGCKTRS